MFGNQFTTTSDYADSTVGPLTMEALFSIATNQPVFMQVARKPSRSNKQQAVVWDLMEIPLPACDIRLSRCCGVRFITNGATAANVSVVVTYPEEDVYVDSFGSNS